ncbi:hypothetical protein DACRYDRAFT_105460 [Dacryopinax primogenitus]|uniref:Uncharacterized protein n=1 Tax=Dacryopinax primogenitus (strain DJM 731) TaxID=1858805 RepID=M5G8C3_DACPD|nr:uncharacterized protein DACRYDRAFT_105460 [Dacryopinax primogenitus]EJU04400.1 hypothetical protein DACRYDRAFT_105460 [Dacryopinax primogenitus]
MTQPYRPDLSTPPPLPVRAWEVPLPPIHDEEGRFLVDHEKEELGLTIHGTEGEDRQQDMVESTDAATSPSSPKRERVYRTTLPVRPRDAEGGLQLEPPVIKEDSEDTDSDSETVTGHESDSDAEYAIADDDFEPASPRARRHLASHNGPGGWYHAPTTRRVTPTAPFIINPVARSSPSGVSSTPTPDSTKKLTSTPSEWCIRPAAVEPSGSENTLPSVQWLRTGVPEPGAYLSADPPSYTNPSNASSTAKPASAPGPKPDTPIARMIQAHAQARLRSDSTSAGSSSPAGPRPSPRVQITSRLLRRRNPLGQPGPPDPAPVTVSSGEESDIPTSILFDRPVDWDQGKAPGTPKREARRRAKA